TLGSATDTDDVLQDAYLRWAEVDLSAVRDTKSYLAQLVTRQALNALRAGARRREEYVGPWLPEPLLLDEQDPSADVVLAESVSMAMLVLLETLSPDERGVRAAGGVRVRILGDGRDGRQTGAEGAAGRPPRAGTHQGAPQALRGSRSTPQHRDRGPVPGDRGQRRRGDADGDARPRRHLDGRQRRQGVRRPQTGGRRRAGGQGGRR